MSEIERRLGMAPLSALTSGWRSQCNNAARRCPMERAFLGRLAERSDRVLPRFGTADRRVNATLIRLERGSRGELARVARAA